MKFTIKVDESKELYATQYIEESTARIKKHPARIKKHPQYTDEDYAYLSAKGYTDDEILRMWDKERGEGKAPVTWSSPIAKAKLKYYTDKNGG